MKVHKVALSDLFSNRKRYVVPLFQRPYVWNLTRQWEPLWQDITQDLAEAEMTPLDLPALVALGESPTLEFKRSTGELRQVLQTLCAFANGDGGRVIIGVKPSGEIVGQQVSEQTLHEIAQAADGFEPPILLGIQHIDLGEDRTVLVLSVPDRAESAPFTYDGRPWERVANTTRKMPQERYEALLLARAHGRRRWENEPAEGVGPRDLDREEIFRIVEAARSTGRLVGPVGRSVTDVLDRLGVRRDGRILQAAVVLFGKTFLPDYPQCELRMARFKGTDKTEFLDQRHIRGPAFKLLEEAELFCQRHFPLPGRIEPGKLQRVDRPLIPPEAMREILVNAVIHRDYSIAGGAISLAIFDDRVEVWSVGRYPSGITAEMLTRTHPSVQRNPILAEVFHRTGLIEKWGRGTNRVASMCREAGIKVPEFDEIGGAVVVTFRVRVRPEPQLEPQLEPRPGSRPEPMERRVLAFLQEGPLSRSELARRLGQTRVSGRLNIVLRKLAAEGRVALSDPEKPTSPSQKYRLVGER